MNRKPEKSQPASDSPSVSQPWRDRLLKQQQPARGTGPGSAAGKTPTGLRNRFGSTAPEAIDRKSRKGMRPG